MTSKLKMIVLRKVVRKTLDDYKKGEISRRDAIAAIMYATSKRYSMTMSFGRIPAEGMDVTIAPGDRTEVHYTVAIEMEK